MDSPEVAERLERFRLWYERRAEGLEREAALAGDRLDAVRRQLLPVLQPGHARPRPD